MWDDLFKRWIDLLFWWVPRNEETRREKAKESAPGATEESAGRGPVEALERQVEPVMKPIPDDLTVIKGIGPVVQEKLRSLGIATFRDLAAADPEALTEQLKGPQPISKARVRGWTEAASQRIEARD